MKLLVHLSDRMLADGAGSIVRFAIRQTTRDLVFGPSARQKKIIGPGKRSRPPKQEESKSGVSFKFFGGGGGYFPFVLSARLFS